MLLALLYPEEKDHLSANVCFATVVILPLVLYLFINNSGPSSVWSFQKDLMFKSKAYRDSVFPGDQVVA